MVNIIKGKSLLPRIDRIITDLCVKQYKVHMQVNGHYMTSGVWNVPRYLANGTLWLLRWSGAEMYIYVGGAAVGTYRNSITFVKYVYLSGLIYIIIYK